MIDEESSASGQYYASDRSAIGAGSGSRARPSLRLRERPPLQLRERPPLQLSILEDIVPVLEVLADATDMLSKEEVPAVSMFFFPMLMGRLQVTPED